MRPICFLLWILLCNCSSTSSRQETDAEKQQTDPRAIQVQRQKKETYTSPSGISASNEFEGARAEDIRFSNDSIYVTINPENTPINASAWFALALWAESNQDIHLTLRYTHHKHRYLPKVSNDQSHWQSLSREEVSLSNDSTQATFSISVSKDTLWVAAQEVISSSATYQWVDSTLHTHEFLEKEIIGKTLWGNDLVLIKHEQTEVKPSVVFIARQHPPEVPGGVIAFRSFFHRVMDQSSLSRSFREKFNVYTFPLLNPDGADAGHWRHNANGKDLNRDWIGFSQPETQITRDYLLNKSQEGKKIVFGIDFHTSYTGPYLLILDSLNELKLPTKIIPQWTSAIPSDHPAAVGMQYRRRSQELSYCYNWFFREFGAEAVTYEDGDEIARSLVRERGELFAEKWMEALLNTKF